MRRLTLVVIFVACSHVAGHAQVAVFDFAVTLRNTLTAALKEYQAAVAKLFDSVDAIVTPASPGTAPLIAGPIDGMKILRNTWPFNAAGTPAISIPAKTAGLPVGIQLVAKRGNDDKLLQIARTLPLVQ